MAHMHKSLRYAGIGILPVLHLLKDASQRAAKLPCKFGRQTTILQPKTQIKLLVKDFHNDPIGLRTDEIMHPSQDPFSRARLPYLECSPPRYVNCSIVDLVKGWEHVMLHTHRGRKVHWNLTEMRDEFNWHLSLATKESKYPYSQTVLPKIHVIADFIFDPINFAAPNDSLAAGLLELLRSSQGSFDALFLTSQLLCLPHFKQYTAEKKKANLQRQMKSLGRRLALINSICGHPESTFWNVKYFQSLYFYQAKSPEYHKYRRGISDILESMVGSYPDTRASTALAALECTYGGDIEKARKYCVTGLQRATRPRGFETALIYAGKLIPDIHEAVNALQMAVDLLVAPVISAADEMGKDRFPFATKQRWIYKYQNLQLLAQVIKQRGLSQNNSTYAREMMRIREQVLLFRRDVKKKLEELGVSGQETFKLFYPGTIDEMMFELLDPEVVLDQEEFMKNVPAEAPHAEGGEGLEKVEIRKPVQRVGKRRTEFDDYVDVEDVPLDGWRKDIRPVSPVSSSARSAEATPV